MMNPKEWPEKLLADFNLKLNNEDLEIARNMAADPAHKFRETSLLQAENMASVAHIELNPSEISLYCALRKQMPPSIGRGPVKDGDQEIHPWQLSDQKLLAAVLQLTGDQARLQKFIEFFPNIFKTDKGNEAE